MLRLLKPLLAAALGLTVVVGIAPSATAQPVVERGEFVQPGNPLRITVDQAVGGKTVIGQLTVAQASQAGFVTAWDCSTPRPEKSDLNYNGFISSVASNRLIVTANNAGEICFYTLEPVHIIVDVFAVTDGVQAIPNQRFDTRPLPSELGRDPDSDCVIIPVYDGDGNLTGTMPGPCGRVKAGEILRFQVRQAFGGKTVVGQLTVAQATGPGFVTAYPCADGIPQTPDGQINKSDLNYDGRINPVASNRLIVKADAVGFVCFYTLAETHIVVDINGIAESDAITPFDNQRTDTRIATTSGGTGVPPGCRVVITVNSDGGRNSELVCGAAKVSASSALRINVPQAAGGKTVVGQLTMTQAAGSGFFTAYGCADGIPRDDSGNIAKSDLNFTSPTAVSNRLIVQADNNGDICIYTLVDSHIVVDINGIFETIEAFDNQRTDTRLDAPPPNPGDTKNCSDFATYAEAKAWFDTYFPFYGDIARLDQDKDLIPCESLPGAP